MSDQIIDLTPIAHVISLPDPRDNKWNERNATVLTKAQFDLFDPSLQKQMSDTLNEMLSET